ncbi:RiPP maturation radical SAM C-methyltransferase [Solwaraspora sp. WMMD1047]|uniref:RiPP maturation radical SAM C-methyltransferase n=1 Tax=Solwaraspora sp. WMMD1047 TaxID=3016102 RepID=UPI0024174ECF|nr:RiPP maturation radical SAM C-methyltransferase [Solwaraspora sp. WMMD1047]MDG4830829.1 RiPP maturation radical SAM C-methyltransferase [Solwaraspora sp. WMMD1047]
MRIVLVHMPWAPIDIPSLALGILRTAAERQGHEVHVRYANLDLVDWLTKRTSFDLGSYQFYSESSYFQGAGDWVFSSALYHPRDGHAERFAHLLAREGAGQDEIELSAELYQLAPEFIEHLVADLADLAPDLVGFTTTFQQNTASLAAARLLKQRLPAVRTVFGGANCDGPQGAALHRNFPFLDHVVRGEGEIAFPDLLTALAGQPPDGRVDAELAAIPGLCWRKPDGTSVANPMARRPLPPGEILPPTFDGFFDRLDASAASGWVEPRLVVEGARGCWWGEKHHCTFCGLNGSFMEFRSKSPDRFYTEVVELARRHRLLDFFVVDNILDMGYFDSVLARLVESGYDLRMQYEVKSNLRRDHFQRLADSGAVYVQPGIESLNSHVLKLMDKGVSGCQNVRALRDAESAGVTTTWNYLYGFPGETPADYLDIIEQVPRLHHLAPPVGVSRIAIERFSPYFNRPELGFADLRPAPQYAETYLLPESELAELAYLFSAPPQGIGEELGGTLRARLDEWREAYPDSRLGYHDLGDRIVLVSQRAAYDWRVLELTADLELALFRLLHQPRTPAVLAERTAAVGGDPARVAAILADWSDLGLVFTDAGTWIQVATEANNQMLLRVQHRHRPAHGPAADEPARQPVRS